MATNPDEQFIDQVVIHVLGDVPHTQHVIICNPGDWHDIKAELGNTEGWLEVRYGNVLVVVGTLTAAAVDRPGDRLGSSNPLGAAADDVGSA